MKIEGLSELMGNLRTLQRNARALDGEHRLSFRELFPEEFMARHTDFGSMQEMLDVSGMDGHTEEEFKAILHGQEWNHFVARRTTFSGWEEMQRQGAAEWARERLHRGLK